MFVINHQAAGENEFQIISPGDYEVTVTSYEKKNASTGSEMYVFDYEIRSDVDQQFQGRKIKFDNFVINENSMWKLHAVSKAAKFPNGVSFSSYKEWADQLKGSTLIVNVGHQEYNGQKQVRVKSYKESKYDSQSTILDENPFSKNYNAVEVREDELPF